MGALLEILATRMSLTERHLQNRQTAELMQEDDADRRFCKSSAFNFAALIFHLIKKVGFFWFLKVFSTSKIVSRGAGNMQMILAQGSLTSRCYSSSCC